MALLCQGHLTATLVMHQDFFGISLHHQMMELMGHIVLMVHALFPWHPSLAHLQH